MRDEGISVQHGHSLKECVDVFDKIRSVITVEKFRYYLQSNLSKNFAIKTAFECPIASFITEKKVYGDRKVGFNCYGDDLQNDPIYPEWAVEFGKAVDREPGRTITGQRALEVLDKVLSQIA